MPNNIIDYKIIEQLSHSIVITQKIIIPVDHKAVVGNTVAVEQSCPRYGPQLFILCGPRNILVNHYTILSDPAIVVQPYKLFLVNIQV